MTYQGHIENGTIVLDQAPRYPNGTTVLVELTVFTESSAPVKKESGSLYDRW